MSLKADIIASVVLDLVTSRVASNRIPLTSTMALVAVLLMVVVVLVVALMLVVLVLFLQLLVGLLVSLEFNLLSLKTSLLILKSLTLLLLFKLSILLGLLFLVVVVVHLVCEKSGTKGEQTTGDSEAGISSLLLVLQRLNPLQMNIHNSRDTKPGILLTACSMVARVLAGDVMSCQGQSNFTVLFAVRSVDREDGVEVSTGGMDDLVEGDGCKGNDGVGSIFFIHDLDEEVLLAIERGVEGLVPDGVLAGVLVDEGLLEGLGVFKVKGEAEVRVLLAKGLLKGMGIEGRGRREQLS